MLLRTRAEELITGRNREGEIGFRERRERPLKEEGRVSLVSDDDDDTAACVTNDLSIDRFNCGHFSSILFYFIFSGLLVCFILFI